MGAEVPTLAPRIIKTLPTAYCTFVLALTEKNVPPPSTPKPYTLNPGCALDTLPESSALLVALHRSCSPESPKKRLGKTASASLLLLSLADRAEKFETSLDTLGFCWISRLNFLPLGFHQS